MASTRGKKKPQTWFVCNGGPQQAASRGGLQFSANAEGIDIFMDGDLYQDILAGAVLHLPLTEGSVRDISTLYWLVQLAWTTKMMADLNTGSGKTKKRR